MMDRLQPPKPSRLGLTFRAVVYDSDDRIVAWITAGGQWIDEPTIPPPPKFDWPRLSFIEFHQFYYPLNHVG
jgi:hypothetical protein